MKVTNKKAFFEYFITETVEAGIALTGPEVKSVKSGGVKLDGSYVKFLGTEAFLIGATIPLYQHATVKNYDSQRTRKLLLHRKQIISLSTKIAQERLTIVPVSCYTIHGFVKLKIGLAKRKQQFDQREVIRRRDIQRETERILKNRG